MTEASPPRVLLLVEDNAGDAELASAMLDEGLGPYQLVHVPRIDQAIDRLRARAIDVVVLDLSLPDCAGVESVRALRQVATDVPIVVLTGSDDEALALACIDAGAQDYLAKQDTRARNLNRAIGYAMTRVRESQMRELQEQLDRYRALSSRAQTTLVTASIAGTGAIAARDPDRFEELVRAYFVLLEPYLAYQVERIEVPRVPAERIVTALGDASGGPRDLLDLHVTALDRAIAIADGPRARSLAVEARLLALEMMGLLVEYYRVGQRRRFGQGERS